MCMVQRLMQRTTKGQLSNILVSFELNQHLRQHLVLSQVIIITTTEDSYKYVQFQGQTFSSQVRTESL